jgi:hypothetical protein
MAESRVILLTTPQPSSGGPKSQTGRIKHRGSQQQPAVPFDQRRQRRDSHQLKTKYARNRQTSKNLHPLGVLPAVSLTVLSLAYFDPGPGSLLVQAIVGGLAGLMVFGKYLWNAARFLDLDRNGVRADSTSLSAVTSGENPNQSSVSLSGSQTPYGQQL